MSGTGLLHPFHNKYQQLFEKVNTSIALWDSTTQSTSNLFPALNNILKRLILLQTNRSSLDILFHEEIFDQRVVVLLAQKHVLRLEQLMGTMRKNLATLQQIIEDINECNEEGKAMFNTILNMVRKPLDGKGKSPSKPDEKSLDLSLVCIRSITLPSIVEYVEWLACILKMYEREFWKKKSIVESIVFIGEEKPDLLELSGEWGDEKIDRKRITEIFSIVRYHSTQV